MFVVGIFDGLFKTGFSGSQRYLIIPSTLSVLWFNILLSFQEVVSDIVTSGDQLLKGNSDDEGELIPLVPVREKMFKDVEHTALVRFGIALKIVCKPRWSKSSWEEQVQ